MTMTKSRGRPAHPRGAPLPVAVALIDDSGKFRALCASYTQAVEAFAKLNLDEDERAATPLAETEGLLMGSGWTVQRLKPLIPATDGIDLCWIEPDNKLERSVEPYTVWLP